MASVTSRVRTRLCALWKTLVEYKEMDEILLEHNAIPDEFLKANKIRLIPHDFERTDDESVYLSCDPPILFKPLSQSTIDIHPISWERGNTIFRAYTMPASSEPEFKEYIPPSDDCDYVYHSSSSPMSCAMFLAHGHLGKWVFGGFPRKDFIKEGKCVIQSLAQLSGITRVCFSHVLYESEGVVRKTGPIQKHWDAFVHEYNSMENNNQAYYPHVLLLSMQSDFAHDGSIMHGELTQLITAMRNRACQPVKTKKYKDEDVDSDSDSDDAHNAENGTKRPDFAFKYEQRFPVLMVSLVGPQHARIYYACMDGSDVVVRQSRLYSFEKRETAPLDYFASFLASTPLEEALEQ